MHAVGLCVRAAHAQCMHPGCAEACMHAFFRIPVRKSPQISFVRALLRQSSVCARVSKRLCVRGSVRTGVT